MKISVIIPSGGLGKRINTPLPKQYLKIFGKEIIAYTLLTFQKIKEIDEIIIAADPFYFKLLQKIIKKYDLSKVSFLVEAGSERQYSVENAIKLINPTSDNIVLVHDAVRPLVSSKIIKDAIKAAIEHGNSVVAIKSKDTLLKGTDFVSKYLDRDEIFYVQTPQVFNGTDIRKAFYKAKEDNFLGTDESMLVKKCGKKIFIVEGSSLNFKITNKDDLHLFKSLVKPK
ncbi:MAG: 2-C-methyl-D-erythritol 4-phosphate cytidylyltransferase [Melioribacteraceae bacterium]|nr:2-C-methyl-D-erythritol 4-phosphate cytidylyltransferase [Melioribacteraceae bacterium]